MATAVVFIEWEDSSHAGSEGWQDGKWWGEYKPLRCFSVGRVLFEDKDQIVLAPHWHDSNDELRVQGCMRIPKSAVRRRLRLLTNGKRHA